MPKRVLDGEALWLSDKLNMVEPPRFRGEYANMHPLALANGSFECDSNKVWRAVYSYNRPDVSREIVAAILDEFERVHLLFRWTVEAGKVWGYWTGQEKPGRLPSAARMKERHEKEGLNPPSDQLERFQKSPITGIQRETIGQPLCSDTGGAIRSTIAEFLNNTGVSGVGSQQETIGQPIGSLGFGSGSGSGIGNGSDSGVQSISAQHPNLTSSHSEERQDNPLSTVKSVSSVPVLEPSPTPNEEDEASSLCQLLSDLISRSVGGDWQEHALAILKKFEFKQVEAISRWALDGVQDPDTSKFWKSCTFSMKNLRQHLLRIDGGGKLPPIVVQFTAFTKKSSVNSSTGNGRQQEYKQAQYSVATRRTTNAFLK
jgi:hypothetical protein